MKLSQKQLDLSLLGKCLCSSSLFSPSVFWKFRYNSPKEEQPAQGIALADPLPAAWINVMVLVGVWCGCLRWLLTRFLVVFSPQCWI